MEGRRCVYKDGKVKRGSRRAPTVPLEQVDLPVSAAQRSAGETDDGSGLLVDNGVGRMCGPTAAEAALR